MAGKIINYVMFQAGWLACVWGAGSGRPWLGPLVVIAALGLHLLQARFPGREALLLVCVAAVGLVFDTLLLRTGWVGYPNGHWIAGLAPYWMIALWVLFGSTLNQSLGWLHGRLWMAAIFGAIGGPLSYLAGLKLGAMSLFQPAPALIALALGWALILPLLYLLAGRFNGFAAIPSLKREADYDRPDKRISGHA